MYFTVTLKTDRDSQELAADAMWAAGASGVEINDIHDVEEVLHDPMNWDYVDDRVFKEEDCVVKGVFTDGDDLENRVRGALGAYPFLVYKELKVSSGEEEDWENSWKKFYTVRTEGDTELVPIWLKDSTEVTPGKFRVIINPSTAFGTGTHESTRLALRLMAGEVAGKKVLDIGTGSGVLGVAAAKGGASRVLMTDFDPEAVKDAIEAAKLNEVSDRTEVRLCSLTQGIEERFDTVLANLTADILKRLLPDLSKVMAEGGVCILSGILTDRAEEVIESFAEYGFVTVDRADEGEWTALKTVRKTRVSVFNLGCKTNQYECDEISGALVNSGFSVTEKLEYADDYIINTCAVTAEAERKSRQIISRVKKFNPDARVFIIGCASEKNPAFYLDKHVQYVSGVGGKYNVIKYLTSAPKYEFYPKTEFEYPVTLPAVTRTRCLVKIQDGCNNFCSYCVIPYLRGLARSRTIADSVSEIKKLAESTREIVITGINLSAYGIDTGESLSGLIRALKDIDVRIRLGSFYAEGIDDELLTALKSLKEFCPHFHLSLQSGSDAVLKAMNRKYSAADYLRKVELIRSYFPYASITTDIIVGFPGETDSDFNETIALANAAEFSDIHVFPFSAREGTVAYNLKKLPKPLVKQREDKLLQLKAILKNKYLEKMLNIPQKVVFETESDGFKVGYSEYYIKFYVDTRAEYAIIKPTELYSDGLKGEIINE